MIGLINHVFIQLVFSEVWISLFWYQILTCFILLVHFPVHFCSYREKFISLYCRLSAVAELDSLNTQQSLREAISDSEVAAAKQRHQQVLDLIQVTVCFIWGKRKKEGTGWWGWDPSMRKNSSLGKRPLCANRLLIWLKCRTQGSTSF